MVNVSRRKRLPALHEGTWITETALMDFIQHSHVDAAAGQQTPDGLLLQTPGQIVQAFSESASAQQ